MALNNASPTSPATRGARHSGAYETPAAVARFVCREALREYLVARLTDDGATEGTARQQATALLPAGRAAPEDGGTRGLSPPEADRLRAAVLACRVCDPAAGDGALLIAMLGELHDVLGRLGGTQAEAVPLANLYGADVDERAVRRCRANLFRAACAVDPVGTAFTSPTLRRFSGHVVRGDSLLDPVFGYPADGDGFDIVVANPPYVSFGLRGTGAAASAWAEAIRARYPDSAEYKLSTYAVFMDRCLALTRPGGICCCLTPDSYLVGRYFGKLRRRLLEGSAVRSLALIEEDFWEGGVVGRPVVGVFRAGRRPGERPVLAATRYRTADDLAAGRGESCACAQAEFEAAPRHRFRLFFAEEDRQFVAALERGAVPLGDFVSFASGLIGRGGRAAIVADEPRGPTWRRGIDSGGDVLPYRVRYRGKYLNFSPPALKSGFRDARYDAPKVLLRQTGDALTAAYDVDGLHCLNNVHVGNAARPGFDVRVAVAVLNSRLLNRYYRLVSLEGGRALAQVDLDVVESLPFKPPAAADAREMSELVTRLQGDVPRSVHEGYVGRLEQLVRRAYLGEEGTESAIGAG